MKTIAIAASKGGTGKTTTAVNIAGCLAESGHRVLLVDMDPQGDASLHLGVRDTGEGLLDDLCQSLTAPTLHAVETESGVHLAPSGDALDLLSHRLERAIAPHIVLQRALASVEYDYCIIDCPPGFGLQLTCALVAARWVLVPVEAKYLSYANVRASVERVHDVRDQVNPHLELLGILPTMVDARVRLSADVIELLREEYDRVFEPVHMATRIAEAPSAGIPINLYDPDGRGHVAYRQLTMSIMELTQ